jgi:hypothetical protein
MFGRSLTVLVVASPDSTVIATVDVGFQTKTTSILKGSACKYHHMSSLQRSECTVTPLCL